MDCHCHHQCRVGIHLTSHRKVAGGAHLHGGRRCMVCAKGAPPSTILPMAMAMSTSTPQPIPTCCLHVRPSIAPARRQYPQTHASDVTNIPPCHCARRAVSPMYHHDHEESAVGASGSGSGEMREETKAEKEGGNNKQQQTPQQQQQSGTKCLTLHHTLCFCC